MELLAYFFSTFCIQPDFGVAKRFNLNHILVYVVMDEFPQKTTL
jgi:hypothetical protein